MLVSSCGLPVLKPSHEGRKVEVARCADEVLVWRALLMEFERRLAFESEFTSLTEDVLVCDCRLAGMRYS